MTTTTAMKSYHGRTPGRCAPGRTYHRWCEPLLDLDDRIYLRDILRRERKDLIQKRARLVVRFGSAARLAPIDDKLARVERLLSSSTSGVLGPDDASVAEGS